MSSEMDETSAAPFASLVRELRVRLVGKQLSLANSLGCTDSAISFWESGARIPSPRLLANLVTCLKDAGASSNDVSKLITAYRSAIIDRRQRLLDLATNPSADLAI